MSLKRLLLKFKYSKLSMSYLMKSILFKKLNDKSNDFNY